MKNIPKKIREESRKSAGSLNTPLISIVFAREYAGTKEARSAQAWEAVSEAHAARGRV